MTSTPTAGRRASDYARLTWVWYVAAAVVFVLVVLLRSALSGPESAERQIGHQVYDESCFIRVSPNKRVARKWPQASKAETISCDTSENDPYPNWLMDYAEFASPAALSAALDVAPPDGMYCTFGRAVVVLPDFLATFRPVCTRRGGRFHAAPAE